MDSENYIQIDYSFLNLNNNEINLIKWAENKAFQLMNHSDVHGIGHIYRVVKNCIQIANVENKKFKNINYFVLLFSAWTHDLGREYQKFREIIDIGNLENHSLISVKILQNLIDKEKIRIDNNILESIFYCIKSHSFSAKLKPSSIEAKILSDADKLDALGAIGIFRASCFHFENNSSLYDLVNHFYDKLLILDKYLFLNYSKRIAKKRIKIMKKFLKDLNNETSYKIKST